MRHSILILLSALLLSGSLLTGQPVPADREIRKLYFNLDTLSGNRLLMQHYAADSPEAIRIIGYRDFIRSLLYQSKFHYDLFSSQSGKWLQSLGKSRSDSPAVPAAIAEIHLYRAVLAAQFSDYKASAMDLVASYKAVARSGTLLITSDLNKLSGILGIIFQQVPVHQAKYLRLLGVRPAGLSGYNGLERYYRAAAPGSIERMEGYLLMVTALKEFSQDPSAAWNFIQTEGEPMLDHPLIRYQSALAALKAGDCESAVSLLDRKAGASAKPIFPYWSYQLGRCKLYRNDPDAIDYLENFLGDPGGDNYRHIARLMAGWYYIIHKQQQRAAGCFGLVRSMTAPLTTYDRQALREAEAGKLPAAALVKTRLLFDGGYYGQCLEFCQTASQPGQYTDAELGELLYRQARCEQRLGKILPAIISFKGVVDRGPLISSYIVPNAALQLGHLYKKTGQVELARKYYQVCVDENHYGHREGLNRQAQAALKELER